MKFLVSKDEDFARMTLLQKPQAQIIWVRLGNCRKAELLAAFESVWDQIEHKLQAGEFLIEIC